MKLAEIISQNTIVKLDTLTSDNELVTDIQTNLNRIGLIHNSSIDGIFNSITQAALNRFCEIVFLDNFSIGLFGPTLAKKIIEFRGPLVNSEYSGTSDMGVDKFETALNFTLLWEDSFVNYPIAPDGATNKGIPQKTYNSFRIRKRLATKSVEFIQNEEVQEIYQDMYWKPSQARIMELHLAVVMFDSAVLCGIGGATKFLQEALGITADGVFGPQTREALDAKNNAHTAIKTINKREEFHRRTVSQNLSLRVLLEDWLNRINQTSPKAPIGLRHFLNNL